MRARLAVLGVVLGTLAVAAQQQQPPRFRAAIDIIPVDVTVLDAQGRPVQNLQAEDFAVRIDGRPRRIVSLAAPDRIISTAPSRPPSAPPAPGTPEPRVRLEPRPVILVLDQPNIRFGGLREHRDSLYRFIDGLATSDPIMVVSLGSGARSTGFTTDRAEVRRAIAAAVGGAPYPPSNKTTGELTVDVLQNLLTELRSLEAAKTIVLVSEGLEFDEQRTVFQRFSREAALARTTIHVLRLNARRTDVTRAQPADPAGPDPTSRSIIPPLPLSELGGVDGLTGVAFATGGFVFNVGVTADQALDRVISTLAGYYLVGVESQAIDVDGQPKPIDVTVNRPGLTVIARRQFEAR